MTQYQWLPDAEYLAVIRGEHAADRFVGGRVTHDRQAVTLFRGDGPPLVVPLSFFTPSGDGTMPDFDRLSFADWGGTVAFGEYEASADVILYEFDPEYRRNNEWKAKPCR